MQHGELHILDNIRSPILCLSWWENFHTTAIQHHLLDDLPINQRVSLLNSETLWLYQSTFDHSHKNGTIMVLANLPNPTVALYFSRFNLSINKYSTRDINLLSFLQATLLQTVRAIIYWEEYESLQQIINQLHGLDEPLAVVSDNGKVIGSGSNLWF